MPETASLRWDAEVEGLCALPIRVVKPVRWEFVPEKDAVRIAMDRSRRETWYKPFVVPVLEGLDAGEDLPGIVRRLGAAGMARDAAVRLARSFVYGLTVEGNLRIETPPSPDVFKGRYARVKELGRGGIGIAWLVHDLARDGAPVVVKHAWNWTGPLATRDRHIRDEVDLMRPLGHPNVVAFIDAFEERGLTHLVRDFVPGEELTTLVLRDGPGRAEDRVARLRTIAGILGHLHERGVLCLDMNPSNFMAQEGRAASEVTISDVGHCKRIDAGREVRLEGLWGTRRYMAPEVLRPPRVATTASDVYSLGRFAYFLATGRPPPMDVHGDDLRAALVEAGATPGEQAFVAACCHLDPVKRPALADALGPLPP